MSRELRIAVAAYRCLYPDAVELPGGVTVMGTKTAPHSPMLNRILGLGVQQPATEETVDEALDALGADVTCYVGIEPDAEPKALAGWLEDRGLEPGWGWMWFRRGVEPLPAPETSLELVPVKDEETTTAFAALVAIGYGLPAAVVPLVARAPDVGWDCWLALDRNEPAGAAGVYVEDGLGYLGFAATVPEHRGKGAQSALLARRIDHAREHGCDLVVTETGERREGLPSSSYRNILRAGFDEVAVRANWLRPAQTG